MSILAKISAMTPPATGPAAPLTHDEIMQTFAAASISLAIAVIFAWVMGTFRGRSVNGPERLSGAAPVFSAGMVTIVGGFFWIALQMGYGAHRAAQYRALHPGQNFGIDQLDVRDYAFLSIVPSAVGWIILLVGDALIAQRIASRLGYRVSNIAAGVGKGILAMLVTLPFMDGASRLLELWYRTVRFEHPMEHELLGAMKEASPHVKMLLIFGACVAAPVFEEFLFRGHLQSVLVRMFSPKPIVLVAPPMQGLFESQPIPVAVEVGGGKASPAARWLAIVITAFFFAIVHDLWMAPLIFLLAICLGYAYERTGNLWTTITMHAIFNISSTIVFLKFM